MKLKLLILMLFIFVPVLIVNSAENNEQLYRKSIEFYGQKKFNEAASAFEQIVKNGVQSPELFYNLGNCYYRLGKTAITIYYYEKALKLEPDDEDIQHNLALANLRTIDKFDEVPEFFLNSWINNIRDSRTSDSWAFTAVILIWLAMGLLAIFILIYSVTLKKIILATSILFVFLFAGAFAMSVMKSMHDNHRRDAIVFSASAYVKSSPDIDGTDLFILHEGSKVQILEIVKQGELWSKIKIANGKTGWMLSSESRTI